MVAITVIVAAVAGAFALGLGSEQQAAANAAVTFEQSPTGGSAVTVEATLNSKGENTDRVEFTVEQAASGGNACSIGDLSTVGNTNSGTCDPGDRLIVIGVTDEGEETVVQQYEVVG
jgi:FlaG/FlaF family flagellin (archaellin)